MNQQSDVIILSGYGKIEHIPDERCFMWVSAKRSIVRCGCQIVISCFIVFEGSTIDVSLKDNRKLLYCPIKEYYCKTF